MLAGGVNCPPTSSLGRWFDAVACLCGLAEENSYEGQAPMLLESAIAEGVDQAYPYRIEADKEPFEVDLAPAVVKIVDDLSGKAAPPIVAAKFHNTVIEFLAGSAELARKITGLKVVVLSGGCFANRYLLAGLVERLTGDGFEVLTHRLVPCNDGGIALGQAVVAAARYSQSQASCV